MVAGVLARNLRLVRVRGEIRGLTRAASGHWYFVLKDDAAQVRCVMFRSRNMLAAFTPRDGDEVEVAAQAAFYEPRGEFQLSVDAIARAGGGRLFEEFIRLRDRLAGEGLFDAGRKRALPALPRAIGIVTSLQAAALRDVLSTLARRAPYVRIVVYPVPVQGTGAGARIAAVLARASARAEVDLLLLVRGGGSIEDLWAFNEEPVARAIAASSLPIVVGVGHESDFTIADFAADLRAPTPTAAAELAAPDRAAMLAAVAERERALRRWMRHAGEVRAQRLDHAMRVLGSPQASLRGLRGRISELLARAQRARDAELARDRARLSGLRQAIGRRRVAPSALRSEVHALAARLRTASARIAPALAHRVDLLQRGLAQFDVDRVLARGFSIVHDRHGELVTRAADVRAGDPVTIRFAEGHADAEIVRRG